MSAEGTGEESSAGPPEGSFEPPPPETESGAGRVGSRLKARVATLPRDFTTQVRRHPVFAGLVVAVAVYSALMGWVFSQRYWSFQTFAWDLGIYNQGLWTGTFAHRVLYYTADLPSGNPGTLLATHFSPVLFLLIPFYALAPNPSGLLVIQAVALGAGALPLYLIARRSGLPQGWAGLVATAYLLSPVVMGVGWYDFHPEALLPATVLWAVYGYYYGSRWTFVVSWLLALAVIESVSGLLFLFGAAGVIALLWDWLRKRQPRPQHRVRTLATALLPLAWLGMVLLITEVLTHITLGTLSTGYSGAYSRLGPNLTFVDVIPYAIAHPAAGLAAISYEWPQKLAYFLILFGSFAFLALLGPKRLLLPAGVWVVLVLLSNGATLYQFGDQNSAYPLPFVAAGAAFGLARLRRMWWARRTTSPESGASSRTRRWRFVRARWQPIVIASAVVLAVGLSSTMVSPLLPSPQYSYPQISYGLPSVTAHDDALHTIIDSIPPAASVLTVSQLFPEVSSRVNAYVVPISSSFQPGNTFVEWLDRYVNDSNYVLLDFQQGFYGSSVIVEFADLSHFGTVAQDDGIILLERGWSGPPQLWVPFQMTWPGGDLGTTQYSYVDHQNSTAYGPSLSSLPTAPKGSLIWYGPYLYDLTPGTYSVTFRLTVTGQLTGDQLRVSTVRNPLDIVLVQNGPTSTSHSYTFDFSNGASTSENTTLIRNSGSGPFSVTENVTLEFHWKFLQVWSVGGWIESNLANVTLSYLTLQQLSP